jgi:hypothetical protein
VQIVQKIPRLWCRHQDILRMDDHRMWLECMTCGRETAGFDELGQPMQRNEIEPAPARAEWRFRALDRAASLMRLVRAA